MVLYPTIPQIYARYIFQERETNLSKRLSDFIPKYLKHNVFSITNKVPRRGDTIYGLSKNSMKRMNQYLNGIKCRYNFDQCIKED